MLEYLTKTDVAVATIRSAIQDGSLQPGDRINIAEWADRLNLSLTPIREAIKILRTEGYLVTAAHRGASVTPFNSKAWRDRSLMRASLEALAAELAIERLTEEERAHLVERMRSINTELHDALRAGDDKLAARLNPDLHAAFIQAANSPILFDTVKRTWVVPYFTHPYFWRKTVESEALVLEVISEHARIIDAIERRDAEAASLAAKTHINNGIRRLGPLVDEDQSSDVSYERFRKGL